jgi:hypothetical protein
LALLLHNAKCPERVSEMPAGQSTAGRGGLRVSDYNPALNRENVDGPFPASAGLLFAEGAAHEILSVAGQFRVRSPQF